VGTLQTVVYGMRLIIWCAWLNCLA